MKELESPEFKTGRRARRLGTPLERNPYRHVNEDLYRSYKPILEADKWNAGWVAENMEIIAKIVADKETQ